MAESNDSYNQARELFKYSLYISEGFLIAVVNAIIVGTVLKSPALRRKKEYIIVGGLALADVWNALGYFTAGTYRTYLILMQLDRIKVTGWSCMLTLHNTVLIVGEPLSAIFLTAVSLDRLIAISVPLKYFKFDRSYALKLSGAFYAFAMIGALVGVGLSFTSERVAKYDAICFTSWAADNEWYQAYYYFERTIGSTLSVVLYVIVVIIFRLRGRKVLASSSETSSRNQIRLRAQTRLMKTLAISSAFTFFFAVLPNGLVTIFAKSLTDDEWAALVPFVLSIGNINPLANIFIYTMRHKDIRKGMWDFLTCKPPQIVDMGSAMGGATSHISGRGSRLSNASRRPSAQPSMRSVNLP